MMKKVLLGILLLAGVAQGADWKSELERELPLMGHRNWIVVADSAYPLQTAPGIKTIYAGGDHIAVLNQVLEAVSRQTHVRPVIFTDAELKHVDEKHAPGIGALREQLQKVLGEREVQVTPHEEIIAQLDEAGETFQVMIIKTDLALPYTSVFIRHDCGYWSAEAENALREAMNGASAKGLNK
jgi:D-ribose pyranose/furanose isomerase RbsD